MTLFVPYQDADYAGTRCTRDGRADRFRGASELLVSLVDDPLVVDELISHGLLIKDGDDLRFRHEIARVVIEAAVPPYRKGAIQTKVLDALLASGSDDDDGWRSMPRVRGMPSCPHLRAESGPSCRCTGCAPRGRGPVRACPAFCASDRIRTRAGCWVLGRAT